MTPSPSDTAANLEPMLQGLNPEQREAVTHEAGPLLIVAGAGTGKTQVITRRIAWLIGTKRARPEEVLALTFADKAASEMETRVDELVPYGFVGATISTFHAFCDRLVREHAIEIGLTSQLRVGTRADLLVFLRERLFELGLDRYLPLGEPDRHLDALLTVFDRARDEDVSPERYLAFAESLAAAASGDPVLTDRAAMELEKAHAYGAYQRLLFEHGRVDFGAQIALALRLLRERPHLAREVQERFRHVLVDEFQDTNHVQFEILKLLVGRRRNLTVVGDDDQSIYRFRGAKIENLLGFLEVYPDARVTVLRRNYRSGQRILDLSHRMVRFNDPERLEAKDPARFAKGLIAERGLEGEVEYRAFESGSDEADAVADDIARGLAEGRGAGEFAVLARTHAQLDPVAQALRARGVRFRRTNQRGLYERAEVKLCLNALRLLADPDDGPAAFGVLADPLFGVTPDDLLRLTARAHRTNLSLRAVAERASADLSAGLSADSVEGIRRAVELLQRLAAEATRRPTSEVLYRFVTESGLLGQLSAEDSAEATEKVQNLNRLFTIVTRVGPLLKSDRVTYFMRHLDLLIDAGDDPQAAVVDSDDQSVALLTAHNAKGLEYPIVYMVQLVEGRFPLQLRGDPLPFPPELHRGGEPRAEHLREERRLFYVAMTRARDRLVMSHAADYGGKRLRKASGFLLEALELPAPPKPARRASAGESIARHAPAAEAPASPSGLEPLADDAPLALSNQRIDDYVSCPLKYRYAHVVQVPLASDPTFMYGTAIHHAIRVFLQHRIRGMPISATDVLKTFEEAWSSEGFYSREHEERRLAEGREALRRFVTRELATGHKPLASELEFRFKVSEHDQVSGRWDRIDEAADGIVLVDYKTSAVDDPDSAKSRASESLREEQLGLYALAYHETRGVMPARAQLHFIGSGIVGEARVELKHLESARERIRAAAAGIRRADFTPSPEPRRCTYCPYHRFCPHSAALGLR
ncbi:MAG: ATP-dependent helicase [Candidatus Eisenbacteria bacterium]|uniref:DNA 3'-5' helicase n=1 Tax=Eiseniibacteriota bacterium TaxID=2212470 RepID=A0A849SZT6_UNCEI|nr:ATP-dependent helicase [Candidatus Eisenbacteria bacterium]